MTLRYKTPPWHWQRAGAEFALARDGSCLSPDMGCGKTKTAIDVVQTRFPLNYIGIIICPKSVIQHWHKEFHTHAITLPRVYLLDKGTVKKRAETMRQGRTLHEHGVHSTMFVVNYEAAILEPLRGVIGQSSWDVSILDECHRIKSPGGVTSWLAKALGKKSRLRLGLTGTPLPHSPLDLYAQYRYLDLSIFGSSFAAFKAQYTTTELAKGKNGKPLPLKTAAMIANPPTTITGFQHMDEFKEKMHSIMFRVMSDDVQDLPEQIDIVRTFTLPPKARKIYDRLEKTFVAELESGLVTAANILVKVLRLTQLTSGYLKLDDDVATGAKGVIEQVHTGKEDLLVDILKDIGKQEPLAIFSWFKTDLATTHRVMNETFKEGCFELSGSRNELAAWQNDLSRIVPPTLGQVPLNIPDEPARSIAVQIQAGKEGVDLTRARYTIYQSLGNRLSAYQQSRKRTHRPGQTKTCFYIHLLAEDTIDMKNYQSFLDNKEFLDVLLEEGVR